MKRNVLVVDDDESILEIIKIILEGDGYNVTTVSDASSIGEALQASPIDLILVDIWISGHDGRVITKHLKKQESTSHIPIVVVSANTETKNIAREAGADAFLEKPFDIENLLSLVKKYTTSL